MVGTKDGCNATHGGHVLREGMEPRPYNSYQGWCGIVGVDAHIDPSLRDVVGAVPYGFYRGWCVTLKRAVGDARPYNTYQGRCGIVGGGALDAPSTKKKDHTKLVWSFAYTVDKCSRQISALGELGSSTSSVGARRASRPPTRWRPPREWLAPFSHNSADTSGRPHKKKRTPHRLVWCSCKTK